MSAPVNVLVVFDKILRAAHCIDVQPPPDDEVIAARAAVVELIENTKKALNIAESRRQAAMTTNELRAKFEAWWKENYWYVDEKLSSLKHYAWMGWLAAHASRDAEVEALRKDAEISRYVLKYAAWIREGDDTLMEIRFAGHVDLSSVGTRRDAIEAAMRNND